LPSFSQEIVNKCYLTYDSKNINKKEIDNYFKKVSKLTEKKFNFTRSKKDPDILIEYVTNVKYSGFLGKVTMDLNQGHFINKTYIETITKNKNVIIHEILHSLGMQHSKNPKSIMYHYYYYKVINNEYIVESYQIFTKKDLNLLKNLSCV
jgi:hypothetical protein